MGHTFRTIKFRKTGGDILEVKLSDSDYNTILKEKAEINNKKQMLEMMIKLKQKGVSFPESWLD